MAKTKEPGLFLRGRSYCFVYRKGGKQRWFTIGAVGFTAARKKAVELRAQVLVGDRDPQQEKLDERKADTFPKLVERYLNEHAKRENKSWRQSERWINRHLLPSWGKLKTNAIKRKDVKELLGGIESRSVRNVLLATASAVFKFAVEQDIIDANPCTGIAKLEVKDRDRVLSVSEIPKFWAAFGNAGEAGRALKLILLTGQRPGEVAAMRREHIVDGWWQMPGEKIPTLDWNGTKNGQLNRIFLTTPVRELIGEGTTGAVFAKSLRLPATMIRICRDLGIESRARPHDLRRTFSTELSSRSSELAYLGVDIDKLRDMILNHTPGGPKVRKTYDRWKYAVEIAAALEAMARHILNLAEGRESGVVIPMGLKK